MSCKHPCHFECVHCERVVCSICKEELPEPTECFKTLGYTCALDGRACRDLPTSPAVDVPQGRDVPSEE